MPSPLPEPRGRTIGGRTWGPGPSGLGSGTRIGARGWAAAAPPPPPGPGEHTDSRAHPGPAGSGAIGSGPQAGRTGDGQLPRARTLPRAPRCPLAGSGARATRRGRGDRALPGPARRRAEAPGEKPSGIAASREAPCGRGGSPSAGPPVAGCIPGLRQPLVSNTLCYLSRPTADLPYLGPRPSALSPCRSECRGP